jgi:hypothetical protein
MVTRSSAHRPSKLAFPGCLTSLHAMATRRVRSFWSASFSRVRCSINGGRSFAVCRSVDSLRVDLFPWRSRSSVWAVTESVRTVCIIVRLCTYIIMSENPEKLKYDRRYHRSSAGQIKGPCCPLCIQESSIGQRLMIHLLIHNPRANANVFITNELVTHAFPISG